MRSSLEITIAGTSPSMVPSMRSPGLVEGETVNALEDVNLEVDQSGK
jgi:hypothetical protein